jgi:hypothetical protein
LLIYDIIITNDCIYDLVVEFCIWHLFLRVSILFQIILQFIIHVSIEHFDYCFLLAVETCDKQSKCFVTSAYRNVLNFGAAVWFEADLLREVVGDRIKNVNDDGGEVLVDSNDICEHV